MAILVLPIFFVALNFFLHNFHFSTIVGLLVERERVRERERGRERERKRKRERQIEI
jgi:hypothetical protein